MNVQQIWAQQTPMQQMQYGAGLVQVNGGIMPMQNFVNMVPVACNGGMGYLLVQQQGAGAFPMMPQVLSAGLGDVQSFAPSSEPSSKRHSTSDESADSTGEIQQKPWMTPELLDIIERKRLNYKNYAANPSDPELRKSHVISRKQAMKAVRKAKREFTKSGGKL